MVVELDKIVKQLKTLFEISTAFEDIRFVTAFDGEPKASPLNRPTVSFSVNKMEEKDVNPVYSDVDKVTGETPTLLYNHTVEVRLQMDIHVPQTSNGIQCYEIYTRMSRRMMDENFSLPFVGVGCGDIQYNRDIGAFTLRTYVDLLDLSIV
ncbi:MAG: hypothetical protein IKU10_06050 [Clostridia bacterium]|nr:hypothetical protein [Clostridia bacterium]